MVQLDVAEKRALEMRIAERLMSGSCSSPILLQIAETLGAGPQPDPRSELADAVSASNPRVVSISGEPLDVSSTVNPRVVRLLARRLADAQAGDVDGVVIVDVDPAGHARYSTAGRVVGYSVIGCLTVVTASMTSACLELEEDLGPDLEDDEGPA